MVSSLQPVADYTIDNIIFNLTFAYNQNMKNKNVNKRKSDELLAEIN